MEIESNKPLEQVEANSHSETSHKIDFKRIIPLVKNPLESLNLTEKDFLYGIIGLGSSIVGYLIWALFVTNRLNALLNPFDLFDSFFSPTSKGSLFFELYSKLIFIGLWSTVSLLGIVWLIGWWKSGVRHDIKSFVTRVGGIHYIGCIGFILAGIFSFSFSFSILIIVVTLLSLFILTLYAGMELCNIPQEKLSLYFILSIAGFILLLGFVPQWLT